MSGDPGSPPARTVGGFDRTDRLWVLVLFGLGGAVLGAMVPVLAGWAADVPGAPFRGPLRLLGSFDDPWLVWGRPGLGLLAGLAFAWWTIIDSPVLDIGEDVIEVRRRGEVERVIERADVAAVRRQGSTYVIETDSGSRLFEGDIEADKAAVRSAFVDAGYPWEGSGNVGPTPPSDP